MIDVTVILSVYEGTDIIQFESALTSITAQTKKPKRMFVVCDGCSPLRFEEVIGTLINNKIKITVLSYEKNFGPGYARDYAIKRVTTKYIAIMDSDDVSTPIRLERQYEFLECNSGYSVVGGLIQEVDKEKVVSVRNVPCDHDSILQLAKYKSPINNVTAFMRTKDYLEVGGYPALRSSEDYCLWARFLIGGKKLANINVNLVNVSFDELALTRRYGLVHFKNDIFTQKTLYNGGVINVSTFFVNVIKYGVFRFLPSFVKIKLYKTVLRG